MTTGRSIIMADDGVPFDGESLESGPLGGAETAFIGLAEGLAALGHTVQAFTRGRRRFVHRGVDWAPVADGPPKTADLYIANRGHRVLDLVPRAKRTVFWLHNPAGYVVKPRYLVRLWRRRPMAVFLGDFHATTLPDWVPTGGRRVIPYGIGDTFRFAEPREPPPPRAVFTSNPLRRLDWVLERWSSGIAPRVPGAELHVYSSLATYGGGTKKHAEEAGKVLGLARRLQVNGVVLQPPCAKPVLAEALKSARVFLYGGDPGETFCLAAAESQAIGVPGVVCRSTCLAERVVDGATGFVLADDDTDNFTANAVNLLTNDALWRRQHAACLATQRSRSWLDAASDWEALLP